MPGGRDERYEPTQLVRYEAATRNQRVEGSWHTTLSQAGHAGGQSTAGVTTNTLALHADGGFEWEGFSGASFQQGTGSTRAGTDSGVIEGGAPGLCAPPELVALHKT